MKDLWRKPYHVVLEVENRQCAIVKRFRPLGLRHIKVADIRSSSPKSVKHLVELDPEEVRQIKNPPPELKVLADKKAKPNLQYGLKVKVAVFAILYCLVMPFWCQEKALLIIP